MYQKKTSKKKQISSQVDDEPTPIGRVQAVPSVVDDKPKVKEDISSLYSYDDEEKESKRGTPGAARKQKEALLDAKEKLKNRLKDDPTPSKGLGAGKKTIYGYR